MYEPDLQEIGLELRRRAVERAAEPLDGVQARVARDFAGIRILQQFADPLDSNGRYSSTSSAPRAASSAA